MKQALLVVGAMVSMFAASAQVTSISVETVLEHDGSVDGVPSGYTTYRLYANLTNELDFVSAVFADAEYPLSLQSTGEIYQVEGGGSFGQDINPAFFPFIPALEYDSWLTIDAMFGGDGLGFYTTALFSESAVFQNFENGEGFILNDPIGVSIFSTFPCVNTDTDLATCADGRIGFAGADLKVLLGQITTDGELFGVFNLQIFPSGNQALDQWAHGLTFSSNEDAVFGCTDQNADNYLLSATTDDLSCIYPCSLEFVENTLQVVPPSCAGENDGSIQIASSGVQGADFFYLDDFEDSPQNFGSFEFLISGVYQVYVVDGAGCVDSLMVEVADPLELMATLVLSDSISCEGANDAVLTIEDISGGNGGYTSSLWSATSSPEPTAPNQWANLAGGQSYIAFVSDSLGCYWDSLIWIPEGPPCIGGCTDVGACNYDITAQEDDGSCLYLDECGICGGGGIADGACDCDGNVLDVLGVCGGACLSDSDGNGVCDDQEIYGCRYELAENYNPDATRDDDSCIFPCEGAVNFNVFDWDEDYAVTVTDFLMMLSVYGDVDVDFDGVWDSGDLCVDTESCNYDFEPSEECAYIDVLGICGGGCEADEDNDGICDDVDTCVGIEDECGVCNGPGPTEVVIEGITILYDSVYLPQLNEWYVYEFGADTSFSYECAPFFNECGDPVSYQGYDYATVLIGEQCWFAENLRTLHYDNGDEIESDLAAGEWGTTGTGECAVYDWSPWNESIEFLQDYGRLYNWRAVEDTRSLCPSGWHVPSASEWYTLRNYLWPGTPDVSGIFMKTQLGWNSCVCGCGGNNESGFTGLPGGYRSYAGGFSYEGNRGIWWSASVPTGYGATGNPTAVALKYDECGLLTENYFSESYGLSVRCIQDAE